MPSEAKYARIEWERRFLVGRFPPDAHVTAVRRIIDRYIEGTTLRLRGQTDSAGNARFKLTQKLPRLEGGAQQGLITTMYLTAAEYEVFASLPAREIAKTRHSVPSFGVDVFEGELDGLVMAEAEFNSAAEATALALPSFVLHEVSSDVRFTGGRLATASRDELAQWLAAYGISLNAPSSEEEQ
jgi:CYTH domain-containing protein